MDHYQFDFSVVMAVYNVEEYLREAVESLVHQTIGFSRIQLIMVDDGSTDGSGKICDEYKERYPNNIVVIHKENGGVASARNAGLQFVQGRYINFLDSDDKFDRRTFKKVFKFFRAHETETDIVTVPIYFFDSFEGRHWQNDKFNEGNRVINLHEEYSATLMFVNASFFKASEIEMISFDSHLVVGEDMKVILKILSSKMTMGVVSDIRYYYRRRQGENTSLIQNAKKKKGWYDDYFTYLVDWCIEEYSNIYSSLPAFVQYQLMSDLQWRFAENYEKDMLTTLNHDLDAIDEYYRRLVSYLPLFNDKYIMEMKMLYPEHKHMILQLKYNSEGTLIMLDDDAELTVGQTITAVISKMKTIWEFISIDKNQHCIIEGYFITFGLKNEFVEPFLKVSGDYISCEIKDRSKKEKKSIGRSITQVIGFKAKFNYYEPEFTIVPCLRVNGKMIQIVNSGVGSFFPVSKTYVNAYAIVRHHIISFEDSAIIVKKAPLFFKALWRECKFLTELWNKNYLGGRKAALGRIIYHAVVPFKRKKLWIVSDRIMNAGDNGEAFFNYAVSHKPKNVKIVFAISKKSPDYERVLKKGNCIQAMSFRHKMLHLLCDFNISSQADFQTGNPFNGHHDALRDLLQRQKFIFLQHGITKDDISDWLNRYNQNITGIVAAAYPEYRSFIEGDYGYDEEQIWLTGFPRFDRLYHDEKRLITVMPTWRAYLVGRNDGNTGIRACLKSFEQSDYFCFYNSLITSERLLTELGKYGYRMQLLLHPIMQIYREKFECDERVSLLPISTSYREVFAQSNLIVTDYSSTAFDFAYLRKPVIYSQFDKDEFFSGIHTFSQGYFEYERDGFGEVVYDLENTIDCILDYVQNDCCLKEQYRERIDSFFAYNDQNNCKRVMEMILSTEE